MESRELSCAHAELSSFLSLHHYPKDAIMKKYVCTVCGHVYDPAENNNVAFDDLPDDWVCPVCGVGKDQFEPSDD